MCINTDIGCHVISVLIRPVVGVSGGRILWTPNDDQGLNFISLYW